MSYGERTPGWLPGALAMLILLSVAASGLPGLGPGAGGLLLGMMALVMAPLSLGLREDQGLLCPGGALGWPLLVSMLVGAVLAGSAVLGHPAPSPWLIPGVAVQCLVLESLARLARAMGVASALAGAGCVLMFAVACAAPVWCGPWAEGQGGGVAVANAVVTLSPASHLAALMDYDYLRAQWFYVHSPLGALRFDYPNPLTISAWCLALSVVSQVLARLATPAGPSTADQ